MPEHFKSTFAIVLLLGLCVVVVKTTSSILSLGEETQCPPEIVSPPQKYLKVNVYSYQLDTNQTDSLPTQGAFGDELEINTNSVAISRDLLKRFEKYDTIHLIMGKRKFNLIVRDKMKSTHRNSIDILTTENITGKGKIELPLIKGFRSQHSN